MRLLIVSGGTGSISLQRGLYQSLDNNFDGVDTKILVNAYDSGLSTGVVRRVMDGRILGPSDVRKNHSTRLALIDPCSPWLRFLNLRINCDASSIEGFLRTEADRLFTDLEVHGYVIQGRDTFIRGIAEFVDSASAHKVDYIDFSFPNIVYAGIAKANGYSLRRAATVMAEMMGIPDAVLLNDDEPLYLGAITEKGRRISDEGEIVSWGKEDEPFVDVFFTDVRGHASTPRLCLEAWQAILEADLIILAPGTQWSSLIPTYASDGFREAVKAAKAEVVMIMNRSPDWDSPSQGASDIVNNLVPRYFDRGRLHVIADTNGHTQMRVINKAAESLLASFSSVDLSTSRDPPGIHNPEKLADAIGNVFFRDCLAGDFYLFDYDDTLVDRAGALRRASEFNLRGISQLNGLTNVGICTGNRIGAITLRGAPTDVNEAREPTYKPLLVFADGGVNVYLYDTHPSGSVGQNVAEASKCICPGAKLPANGPFSPRSIIEALRRIGVRANIEARGNVIIAIRPVPRSERQALLHSVQHVIRGSDLQIRECGTTTIEICRPVTSKVHALNYLRANPSTAGAITYVGDELDAGNDKDIVDLACRDTGVSCLQVRDPAKTAFFIRTLTTYLINHARH